MPEAGTERVQADWQYGASPPRNAIARYDDYCPHNRYGRLANPRAGGVRTAVNAIFCELRASP
jgi:hypothetical protein